MENNLKIIITSKINVGAENEEMSFSAPCLYKEKDNVKYIFYDEVNPETNIKTKCRITINPDSVEIRKSGEVTTTMIFVENSETRFKYCTPFNECDFKVFSKCVAVNFNSQPKTINLVYDLFSDKFKVGNYDIKIKINNL